MDWISGQKSVSLTRAWAMLAVLSLLFIVSMVDRFTLGLLVEPLQHDLGVSDVQLGLLFGSAFALFYGLITFPLARIADRGNRVRLIVIAATLWSICTILSGFATAFWMLVVLRVGLAVGEAALVPAVFSLIGDLLPENRRSFGATIFNACGMAGASGAYIIGSAAIAATYAVQLDGYFATLKIWQAVFFIVGAPGLVLALILLAFAKEPVRRRAPNDVSDTSFAGVLRYARSQGWLYPGLFLGAGCLQWGTNGFLAWTPTYLSRAFGVSIVDAGKMFGSTNLVAFVTGSLIVPTLGAWMARRRSDAIVLITIIAAVLSSLLYVAAVFQSSPTAFLVCTFLASFTAVGGASNVVASIHLFTPPQMRATLTAAMLVCLTTIALGIAPPLVGGLSGKFGTGRAALGVGLGAVAALGAVIAVTVLLCARRRILTYLSGPQNISGGPDMMSKPDVPEQGVRRNRASL